MFTHAIETNVIIAFINNSMNVALTKVRVWNYTIIRKFWQQIRFYNHYWNYENEKPVYCVKMRLETIFWR